MTPTNDVKKRWVRKEVNDLLKSDAQEAIENILREVRTEDGRMLLYSDRTDAVAELSLILRDLDSGKLTGNSSNHLLIGPKSVGKTSFLQGLVFAMQKLGKSTLSAYIDVSKHSHREGPYDLIFDIFEKMLPDDAWQELNALKLTRLSNLEKLMIFLEKMKWRIFLVLDEYSVVYTLPAEQGRKWIMQLSSIGNWSSSSNPVNVILSGSAPYLRSLCFGKMVLDDISRRDFPSYSGRANNLNSDRFHVIDIKPLYLKSDLIEAYHQLFGKRPTPRQLCNFYLYTGGYLRNFSAYRRIVRRKDKLLMSTYSNRFCFKITKHRKRYERILNAMLRTLFPEEEGVHLAGLYSDPWRLMAPIDVNDLEGLSDSNPRVFYEGSDSGAFLYQQTNERDTLQFSHPIACLILREPPVRPAWPRWFTSHMRVCLRYPYSILGMRAEEVVRRSMGEKDWGLGPIKFPTNSQSRGGIKMKLIFEGKSRLKIRRIQFPVDFSSLPYGIPLQEIPDCKGADVVVFQKGKCCNIVESADNEGDKEKTIGSDSIAMKSSDKNHCCVHRLQIKLGHGSFGVCAARIVLKKLKSGEGVIECLRKTYTDIEFSHALYLVTTRPLTPEASSFLRRNNVTIRDRRWLYKKWPNCVVEWARSCGVKCYFDCDEVCEAEDVSFADNESDEDEDVSDDGSDEDEGISDDGSDEDEDASEYESDEDEDNERST